MRITRRMILALRVLGRSATKSTRSGFSALPMWRATRSESSARIFSPGAVSGRRTTKQMTASPLISWGTPTAADSATAGWLTRTDSTSAGPTRLPAILSVSSERPVTNQKPSSSM